MTQQGLPRQWQALGALRGSHDGRPEVHLRTHPWRPPQAELSRRGACLVGAPTQQVEIELVPARRDW